jgi:hypothetical protein
MRLQAVLTGLLVVGGLAGCFDEPRLSAKTEEAFNRSFEAITKDLDVSDKIRLDDAIRDIAFSKAGVSKPVREAQAYSPPSRNGGPNFSGLTAGLIENAVSSQWSGNRAKIAVEYAGAIIDGHTVTEVLRIADSERAKSRLDAIAIYIAQLEKTKSAISEAETEQDQIQKEAERSRSIIDQLQVTKARFYYQQTSYSSDPIVSFTITNKTGLPVKRVYFHGKVQTPGRAVPWVDADFNHEFPGGLEQGESKNLTLSPNRFMDHWGDVPKEAAAGTVLTVIALSFEDAAANTIGGSTTKAKEIAARLTALRKGAADIEAKIEALKTLPSSPGQ